MENTFKKNRARTAIMKAKATTVTAATGDNAFKTAKTVVIWGGVAVIGFVAFRFVKKLTRDDGSGAADDAAKGLNKKNLSYPESNYGIWADALEQAMYGSGTDEDAIYEIFGKMNNNDDVLMLIVAFGIRKNAYFFIPAGSGTLPIWIQDDLKNSEKAKVNEILANNNITIQF